jgi:uncharacterized RDD family membrane protein YckC
MWNDPERAPARADPAHLGLPAEVRPFQGRRAGVVSRSLAAGVDLAVVALVLIGLYLGLTALLILWSPRNADLPDVSRPTLVTVATLLAVTYLTASWTMTGRTYGDQLFALRVVDSRGAGLRLGRATTRALLCVIFPVGLLWAAVSRCRRSVADLALGTVVIYDWTDRSRNND